MIETAPDVMNTAIPWLEWTGIHMSPWKLIGLVGALMFGGRWLVQFVASKRQGKPVIPRLFWYMSVLGSLMTLSYFLFSAKQDAVGVLQNLFPAFTAIYSLYLDIQNRGWRRDKLESPVHTATSRESLPSGHAPALSSLRGGITR